MNIPNVLTLSRLVLAIVLIALLTITFPLAKSLAFAVFIIAGITDYLDGYLARRVYGVTSFGRLMDPLTDKVLVCAAFVSFVGIRLPYRPEDALVPAWIVVIIIAREFLVTGLRLLGASRGEVISAGKWGKHKTVWQIVAIAVLLLGLAIRHDILHASGREFLEKFDLAFHFIALAVSAGVALITAGSGALYFMQHRELIDRRSS